MAPRALAAVSARLRYRSTRHRVGQGLGPALFSLTSRFPNAGKTISSRPSAPVLRDPRLPPRTYRPAPALPPCAVPQLFSPTFPHAKQPREEHRPWSSYSLLPTTDIFEASLPSFMNWRIPRCHANRSATGT